MRPVCTRLADDRRVAVVAEPAGVDGRRHEVVAERVHRQQRRHAGGVAEVVVEAALGERRARRRLDRHEPHVRVLDERQGDAAEVRAAAARRDDDVGARLAGQRQLLLRLQADHRLVQQHVVEHRAERVVGVVAAGGVAHGVGDGDAERAGRASGRRPATARTPRPTSPSSPGGRASVSKRRPHHVDLALEVELGAGERQRGPPLAGAGLGGQPRRCPRPCCRRPAARRCWACASRPGDTDSSLK